MGSDMSKVVPVLKDESNQQPIPTVWRSILSEIVEGLKDDDFDRIERMKEVRPISENTAARIVRNIEGYGAHLSSLPDETWDTSVCQWMIEYWDLMVDLYTVEEGASDLALHVRVYEKGESYAFEITSVHVP